MSLIIGTQLYGWGQVYAARGQNLADHYDEVLTAIRDIGMDTAETSVPADQPDGIAHWAALLRDHGLKPVSLYFGGALHEDTLAAETVRQLSRAGELMAQAGFSALDLNPNPIGREKTHEELVTQARSLESLGRALEGHGIALGLHNHTPEMVTGGREFHHNLRETDPRFVGLFMDVHWCYRGGGDPTAIFEEYKHRIVGLHVRQSLNGVWAEDFGEGDLDYRPMIQDLVARQFAGPALVEIAIETGTPDTRDVVENHRRSAEYLRSLMG